MNELFAFAAGAAVAVATAALLAAQRRRRDARAEAERTAQSDRRRAAMTSELVLLRGQLARTTTAALAPAPAQVTNGDLGAQPFATAMARELADVVSGIEGGSYRLMESAAQPAARTAAAESLWLAVRRLRHFHDKLAAFVQAPAVEAASTPVEALLVALREELQQSALGLQFAWSLPRTLPVLRGSHEALLDALLFSCHALLQLERGALRLSINVEPCFESEPPCVELELQLEYDEDPGRTPPHEAQPAAFTIARTAAANLIERHGGTIEFEHEPGQHARALARLPAERATFAALPMPAPLAAGPQPAPVAVTTDGAPSEPPLPEPRRHDYGGVLVLESDPTVRSMLASELRAWGRAVFACADGAAVRSLLQATPDRFELLVVDRATRLDAGDASTALRLCPELKVFVLSEPDDEPLPSALVARAHRIKKPFGVQELRRALANVLAS